MERNDRVTKIDGKEVLMELIATYLREGQDALARELTMHMVLIYGSATHVSKLDTNDSKLTPPQCQ